MAAQGALARVRESAPDLLADWREYEKKLLQKIEYRERELMELHQDYIALQALLGEYRKFARATVARRLLERANAEAKGLIDG